LIPDNCKSQHYSAFILLDTQEGKLFGSGAKNKLSFKDLVEIMAEEGLITNCVCLSATVLPIVAARP